MKRYQCGIDEASKANFGVFRYIALPVGSGIDQTNPYKWSAVQTEGCLCKVPSSWRSGFKAIDPAQMFMIEGFEAELVSFIHLAAMLFEALI